MIIDYDDDVRFKPVLARAKRILEVHDWRQGATGDGYCVIEACDAALENSSEDWHSIARILGFPNWHALVAWNDDPLRTKEEVLQLLEAHSK